MKPLYTSAPSIPEGWQLVPIEPTSEMLEAAYKSHWTIQVADDAYEFNAENPYKAMLAAAPKPEETK